MRKCLNPSEYKTCVDGLGLLTGEELRLQYVCFREILATTWDGKPKKEQKKGLLCLTNDNLIFMQQQGAWSSNYSQALRIPLEQIVGMSCGGHLIKHITFEIGIGAIQSHTFGIWKGCEEHSEGIDDAQDIMQRIQNLLNITRAEKKRIVQETLLKGALPVMIFCRYCGGRNKADQTKCSNCGALLGSPEIPVQTIKSTETLQQKTQIIPSNVQNSFDLIGLSHRIERTFPTMVELHKNEGYISVMDKWKVTKDGVIEGSGPAAARLKKIYENFLKETNKK
jgi:hypothetical protein